MTCETCGARLPDGATTCPVCGAAAPAAPSAADGDAGESPGGVAAPPPPAWSSGGGVGAPPPAGQPTPLSSEVRNWAMGAHLSAFVGAWIFLAFVGPLVVWLIRKEVDGFSERHAREALNFNLTLLVVLVVGGVGGLVIGVLTLGLAIPVLLVVAAVIGVAWLVLTIIAAVRASEGRDYRYPMTIRFIS